MTEEKLVKAELLLEDLWKRREEMFGVKEIARLAGVIGKLHPGHGKCVKILDQRNVDSGGGDV